MSRVGILVVVTTMVLAGGPVSGQELRLKAAPGAYVCDKTDNIPAAATAMKAKNWEPILALDCMPITPGTEASRIAVSPKDPSIWQVRIAPGQPAEFDGWASAALFPTR